MVLTRKKTGVLEREEKRMFRTVKVTEHVDVLTPPTGRNTTVFAKIAQMAAGLPDVHPTHTHWTPAGDHRFISEKETPTEVGYDFLIGLLTGIARDGEGGAHTNHVEQKFHNILMEIGEELGEVYGTDEIKPLEKVSDVMLGVGVKVPKFREFLQKHREKVIEEMTEAIYEAYKMRGKIIDKDSIKKAVEHAIEISDKLAHNIFDDRVDPYWIALHHYKNLYDQPPSIQLTGIFDGALKVPREKVLEEIGDHIIELKKIFPNVVKPEEVYGDLWYEFLRKKGINPEELEPQRRKPDKEGLLSPDLTAEKVEVLSILQALEFAGFSEEAKRRAVETLTSRIDELLGKPFTVESLWKIGLYTIAIEIIRRNNFKRIKEIKRL